MKAKSVNESLDINNLYLSTKNDKYWKDISKKFPGYNSPDTKDNKDAINHIINGMKTKYPEKNWGEIEKDIRNKISGSLT